MSLGQFASSFIGATLAIILLLSPVHSLAQSMEEDQIVMNMRDAEIRGVIQWVSDQTGKNILVHNAVQGTITIISGGAVNREAAYELFLTALQVNGFAAQEKNGVITIVPESIAAQGNTPFESSSDAEIVTRLIKVRHIPAAQLSGILKPLLPQHSKISADSSSNSLLIVDRADNLRKIESIVQRMDRPSNGEFDVIKLQHANASNIAQTVSQLIGSDPSAPASSLKLQVSVDDRSNSLLLYGDASKRKNLRQLVENLDQPVSGDGTTQVIYLNYVDADELVPILESMTSVHAQDQGKDQLNVSVNASASTNALVVTAPPALMADMKRVVAQLDIRKAQVLIEALVVQVNHSVANDIGVNWMTTDSVINSADGGVIGAVNALGNLPLGIVSNALNTQPASPISFDPAAGVTFGFFKNGSLRAAIRALSSNTNANILSTPTIIALDNEQAELLVGQSVPFVTGQSTGGASPTSDPFTTIQRQDIGTALRVTPRINQGDSIALQIEQTTESFDQSVDPAIAARASDLITRKTEMRTRALIKDGEVLVIGGLISDEERERKQKVPLLGDIPVLGKLFSSKGVTKSKSNLMVFIHPVILKDAEHRRALTKQRYDFMREKQEQFGEGNGWLDEYRFKPLLPEFELYAPDNKYQASNDQ